ncbi:cytochrome c biogenesis protein ResB, partial [uncultured Duncaniella sp.]
MSVLKSPRVKATLAVVGSLFVGGSVLLPPEVYSSWWWFALWTVAGLLLVALLAGKRMRGRKTLWCFHLSLLLILAGGGVTALTAERGTLRLLPGEHSDVYYDSDSLALPLPVGVRLEKFEVVYYPGMTFPRDFRSVIVTDGGERIVISMNRIGHLSAPGRSWDDYRLYQTSYDSTGATVLTVAHDPFGIALTYAGYALFALAGLLMLVGKSFRRPVRGVTVMALMILAGTGRGEAAPAVPQSLADSLAGKQVLFRGHAVPFESMARKLTLALTGSEKVGGIDATRFIASLTVYPDEWRDVGFLFVKDKGLRKALELQGAYVSPAALYSVDGRYLPETLWRDG